MGASPRGFPSSLALSTAAGLRVFVPLLLTGLAARLGYLTLTPSMTWIASDAALLAFATATVLEVGAYYVPWLDNVLDAVATPAAIVQPASPAAAVTLSCRRSCGGRSPSWPGGGAAGVVQVRDGARCA